MTILLNSVLELFNYPSILVFCITSFIIGSIPFGLIVTKISGYGDIRKIGSGNIGATNVLRTGNKLLALLTLLLDISKSFAFLYFVKINFILILEKELLIILYVLISILSLLGHMFSPFLLLKGGKGIATSAGILFFMNWIGASVILFVWLIVALKYKTSSLGALSASFIAPIIFWFLYKINVIENLFYVTNTSILEVYLILIISILIWIKHISNIKRLISGTESKI
ncbi:MAG: glycerol-3-phosphate 1-O-acyltransferase [Alphaproteobacteria bacterium]|nr:MAG: glycerol-3-phosphate 1-O-acyltransferase [Alphaproteobacteria bacterium]|tara:strand:+ start:5140 stop:5820 length:681 start_codon:yes stop_codon:yes gene_type:complete